MSRKKKSRRREPRSEIENAHNLRSILAVSPSDLAALHTLFDRNLPRALALAESGAVTRITGTPSGRVLFQVRAGATGGGHRGHHQRGDHHHPVHAHTTLPAHYCSCDSFFYEVAGKSDAAACKHQLAARLADAFGSAGEAPVPDEVLASLLIAG